MFPFLASAATGDVIYQCDFSGAGSTVVQKVNACATANWTTSANSLLNTYGEISSTGGPVDNGPYLTFHSQAGGGVDGTTSMNHVDVNEYTIVYYEKFDHWPILGANIKSTRSYVNRTNGNGDGCYYGATIGVYCPGCTTINSTYDRRWYISSFESATVNYTSLASNNSSNGGCTGSSNPYTCSGNEAHIIFNWSTDGWTTWGHGADTWHKFRLHLKTPSAAGLADGKITLWIDEQLVMYSTDVKADNNYYPSAGANFTYTTFFPSDAATEAYDHSMADVTIYEGEVTPGGADTIAPASPSGLSVS